MTDYTALLCYAHRAELHADLINDKCFQGILLVLWRVTHFLEFEPLQLMGRKLQPSWRNG